MGQAFRTDLHILGTIMMVIGIAMLPSFVISCISDARSVAMCFLGLGASCFILGLTLRSSTKEAHKRLHISDGFLIVTVIWLFCSLVGGVPYLLTGVMSSPTDAFFESASGFSTTGATVLTNLKDLPHGILFWRAMTGWIGGIGILIFGIALMPALGLNAQRLTSIETHAAMESMSPKMLGTIRVIALFYGSATILETILLKLCGMGIFNALIHSMSTVSTCGFTRYDEGLQHFNSPWIRIVIICFMILAAGNYNLYLQSIRSGLRSVRHNTERALYRIILIGGSLLVFAALLCYHTESDPAKAGLDALFTVASMVTTTGFQTADYSLWPQISQVLLIALMFTGACASSSGGGIKLARLAILLKLIRHGISTRLHSRFVETVKLNRQGLSADTVSSVATVPFLFLVTLFLGALLLCLAGISMPQAFGSCLACLCNAGSGLDPAGVYAAFPGAVKWILSILMLGGRLELYCVLVLLTPRYWSQSY